MALTAMSCIFISRKLIDFTESQLVRVTVFHETTYGVFEIAAYSYAKILDQSKGR
jgi:hypothetical protein